MPSRAEAVFPTFIYRGSISGAASLNRELAREIQTLGQIDDHGRSWSATRYQGGYSSYSSLTRLHQTSPYFAELEKRLRPHVKKFVNKLNWDLMGRKLQMTTCWANSMGKGTHHTMHTHPMCVLSGVYYVSVPPKSSPLKIEDPRLGLLMAAPPRKSSAPKNEQNYILIQPKAGEFVLFESWMRHEVPPHRGSKPRLSISFNYEF
jgi:uncharacterized protein (TIGR02466 family)